METSGYLSIITFIVTLILMVKRPFRINLGVAAGIGAALSFLFGTISVVDAIMALIDIWDAALAFLGIVLLSVTLDAIGFFRWAALRVAKMARGDGVRLYFYVMLFTAVVSILFANDSAVLILTPIVIEIVRELKLNRNSSLAYLFGAGLMADTAAMPLITSNPVNIVSADYFGYSFVQHLILMGPVGAITILQTMIFLYLFYRSKIPREYSVEVIEDLIKEESNPPFLRVIFATLVTINVGYIIASFNRVPVSFVILSGAVFLFVLYCGWYGSNDHHNTKDQEGPSYVLRRVNWDIFVFMIAIFLVVIGLQHAGVVNMFSVLFSKTVLLPSVLAVIVPSLVVTVGASFINNWPMTMLGLISVESVINTCTLSEQSINILIFANIIGNNLGPHFFPLGSLAILMWLSVIRRKGLDIGLRDYVRVGSILSITQVVTASLILWIEVMVFGITLPLMI